MNWINKLQGDRQPLPPPQSAKTILLAALGATLTIFCIGFLTDKTPYPLMLGAFGASSLLVFGFPDAPFAQPRNVLFGYLVSTLAGLCLFHFVSSEWWAVSLAVGTAMGIMMALRIVHPPAAGNPIVVYVLKAKFSFLFFPTLSGVLLILLLALIYNNATRAARYPKYW
jgi:CBS-domain-containing membrane protein